MVFGRRAIISAASSLSDLTRTIKNGNGRTARIRSRPALLPTRRLLLRRVQSDLRKARSPHRVQTRRPPDSRGQSNATLTAASDFAEMIDVIRPRISESRAPNAVYSCPSACAGSATPGRARATSGDGLMRRQSGFVRHQDGLKRARQGSCNARRSSRNGAKQRDSANWHPFRYQDVSVCQPNGVMRVHKLAGNELVA
jgi:hypothetical protein